MVLYYILGVIVIFIIIYFVYIFFKPLKKNEVIKGKVLQQAKFQPGSHKVKGSALIIQKNGNKYLQLKDFETIRGPDVKLVLSKDLKAKDSISFGKLEVTKGNYYVKISKDIDLKKYNKVLIWCRAFRILFSYAQLK